MTDVTPLNPTRMNEIEARTIPPEIAVCPICGNGIWIESIDECSEEGDRWVPEQVSVTCEDEPDIDNDEWSEWHCWHFSTPYIDWLPISTKVLEWLKQPTQKERFEAIHNSGRGMLAPGRSDLPLS